MTMTDTKRLEVLTLVRARRITGRQAASLLGRSLRTIRYRLARLKAEGPRGLLHRLRGRPSHHRKPDGVRRRALTLAATLYAGLNDSHLWEKLTEVERLRLSRPTLRRWLRAAGRPSPQRRRPPRHRRCRPRRPQMGLMLLGDGSSHAWLEARGPVFDLVAFIDDATSTVVVARFVESESTEAYLGLLRDLGRTHGLPHSLYVDRHSAFKTTRHHLTVEEELEGRAHATQVDRALQELGIMHLSAYSPQAKGRIERLWKTFQDRLVSELRLAGVTTMAEANRVLAWVRRDHNRRFAVPPVEAQAAWRPAPALADLDRICAWAFPSVVGHDNCVRLLRQVVQIPPGPRRRSYAKAHVEVRILLDGRWQVWYQGQRLLDRRVAPMRQLRPHLQARDDWHATGHRPAHREAA